MKSIKGKNVDYSKITPYHFFTDAADKTKFNWFAFELACEIDIAVPAKMKKYLTKKGYAREMFNKSCIDLSKLLQEIILKRLRNEIPDMEINCTEVEKAFPKLNDKTVDQLLTYTLKAWENLLDVCVACTNACVSNKDDYCPMFDDESYY